MKLKRIFDIVVSAIGLIILLPVFILIAVLIKITSRGDVFYRQIRVGQFGSKFKIHKFRTMVIDADLMGGKITVGNDPRVTKLGKILRKSKLDELPQLIDVILGNMSIVGPRPEVPEYVEFYPQDIKLIVLSIKPGITDYASIKMIDENILLARSDSPRDYYIQEIMPQKLKYAVDYVKSQTLWGDFKIIFLTIIKIFIR